MRSVPVAGFEPWRQAARHLLAAGVAPDSVAFTEGPQSALFAAEPVREPAAAEAIAVPKPFLSLAREVALHRDPRRWNLLYRTLYRMVRAGERHLLAVSVDADVRELAEMQKAVARDIHKMHAFVRFRKVASDPEQYVAWHRPDHHIVEHVGPWFARRFGAMRWAILTPGRSAYWDTRDLQFGPGVARPAHAEDDALEDLWRSYYASVFNPARLNVRAMTRELPCRHWATLPEAALLPQLLLDASAREQQMRAVRPPSAEPFLPSRRELPVLAAAIRGCQGCDLHRHATQAVFGEGPPKAPVMLVGEQPGDQEDRQGQPFVGPAGTLLDQALQAAGIRRSQVYVTNAVKHFRFEERGGRRIHKKPRGLEVAACRPWLSAEIEQVDPRLIVALGATAALSVGGREFAVQQERGQLLPLGAGRQLLITVHPSYLLRLPAAERPAEFARFVADLRLAAARTLS